MVEPAGEDSSYDARVRYLGWGRHWLYGANRDGKNPTPAALSPWSAVPARVRGNRVIFARLRPQADGSDRPAARVPGERVSPARSDSMRILFVCKSNAARSQMAEAFLARYSREHTGMSAGVRTAHRGKEGYPVPWQIAEKMGELGIRMDRYRRKQLRRSMVQEADRVIVVMTPGQIRALLPKYVARSRKVTYWTDIQDPQNDEARLVARDQLRRRVRDLVRELGRPRAAPTNAGPPRKGRSSVSSRRA